MIPDSRFVQSPDDARILPAQLRRLGSIRSKRIAKCIERRGALALSNTELLAAWRDHPLERLKDWVNLLSLSSELCFRALGKRPYWTQVLGAMGVMQGRVLEMNTGEGKSLTALLAATAALSQRWSVHVVTANDYLAERDHEDARALFALLGVSSDALLDSSPQEARGQVLSADIVFTTGKELVFEALRDKLDLGSSADPVRHAFRRMTRVGEVAARPYVRALGLAILDEADSVLIDEGSTPCVISGQGDVGWDLQDLLGALAFAQTLVENADYEQENKHIKLTERGKSRVETAQLGGGLANQIYRLSLVQLALQALYRFERNQDYVIAEEKVVIVDSLTGRLMPDRRWEQGLHEMIEAKEGIELSPSQKTLGKMTYPQFFSRYPLLSGMTGTGKEVAAELKREYGLRVLVVPPRLPSQRQDLGIRLSADRMAKAQALVRQTQAALDRGQAVLIGTPSIEQCEFFAAALTEAQIPHQVLDGQNSEAEAEQIAQAGQAGQVTLATSVAGRGTDIHVDSTVKKAGGLHVILTEYQFSSRVDRQLMGRCARQGDPGSIEMLVAPDDELFVDAPLFSGWRPSPSDGSIRRYVRKRQQKNEKQSMQMRARLKEWDEKKTEWLGFLKQL